jgi:hypothetical protein
MYMALTHSLARPGCDCERVQREEVGRVLDIQRISTQVRDDAIDER